MHWFAARTFLTTGMVVALPLTALAQPAPVAAPGVAGPPAAALSAAQPAPPDTASVPVIGGAVVSRDYVLGIGDTVDIALIGSNSFNTRARIGSDGAILLPYLGAFPAANRQPSRLAQEIVAALEKGQFFTNPIVRVDVVGVGSRTVTVLGAVATTGVLPLDREYHLSEIVARVGGHIGPGEVVVTHKNGTSKNYKLIELATAGGEKDPIVTDGDKIYIPSPENQVFYMTGAVKSPGAYPVVEGMTVRTALARSGGLSDQGSEKKVGIKRKGVDVKDIKLDVTTLEPGDIVTVGERLF